MDEEKNNSDQKIHQTSEEPDHQPETSQCDYDSDASGSSTNSDDAEKCPICLLTLTSQEVGKPAVCSHAFCFLCIEEWSKVVKTCPIDRKEFSEIIVFENLDSNVPLRTVGIGKQVSIKEFTNGDDEFTQCEICRSTDREDVMLLCDGCDKGYHMDCLDPPLLEIPEDNWYCINCDNSDNEESLSEEETEEEADVDEISDLQNEIEQEMGQLPLTRLRNHQQPQIIRTLQSERIRNAILARRTLRSAAALDNNLPSTSQGVTRRSAVPIIPARSQKPVTRRKKTTRRRRSTKVVEYEIKDGQKFPVKTTRRVRRKKRRTTRKSKKRTSTRRSCTKATTSESFKHSNSNVYDLQKGRQLAGLSNFNIFEPVNALDYVPDDEGMDEYEAIHSSASGSTLTQAIVNYTNPHRRQALIKKRVINNFATTSSSVNVLDSILNEVSPFDAAISSNKLIKQTGNGKIKKSTNDQHETSNQNNSNTDPKDHNEQQSTNNNSSAHTDHPDINNPTSSNNDRQDSQECTDIHENIASNERKSPQKKKRQTFDMFGDSPVNQEEEMPVAEICPNFSIYGSVNRQSDENLSQSQDMMNEENVDLVQMSDGEHNASLDEMEPPAVVRSQPASPDLENDVIDINDQIIVEERSYTPPLMTKDDDKDEDENEKRKRDKEHKRHKRRELERYNVRERLKEKSPKRNRDRFGRNRTRSRSRDRHTRRNSRSYSRDRHRSRHKKSKSPEKRRKRSYSRSLSRRDSSNERRQKHHKSKHKKYRRTRSRSLTPQQNRYRDKSPRRRERSTSDKSKKKKHRNRSKDERSTHTKEVFTSGQNILVSVNFNNSNPEDKRSRSTHSKSREKYDEEPIVDITAKKKINVNSKPVAIIDLARSPFRELTPEYKKESNVIELSDSEGEKHAPKSPDSTKLYDPFDILNSPSNENVSSSQATTTTSTLKALSKNSIDFTNKLGPAIIKNLNLPLITNNEENMVSSSSSVNNLFDKVFAAPALNNKIEVLQNEVIQIPVNVSMDMAIESPYSPGNDYDDQPEDHSMEIVEETKTNDKQTANIFDELFGSSTPPFLEKAKSSKKSSSNPDRYLNKLKRQERVVEEVKLVIKPYYANRKINKEQYKEIMRKAVPKICHNKSGEINPTKIKHLIDSYVKIYTHKSKKRGLSEVEEIF